MKSTAKMKLKELLNGGPREQGKSILIDYNNRIPKNHEKIVIRFVDFTKRNEKIKAGC